MKHLTAALIAGLLVSFSSEPPAPAEPSVQAETALPLAEYEGLYEYQNNNTLIMTPGPKREKLYAVIDEARYPLTPSETEDVFLNSGGVEVAFLRDADGKITGYRENNSENIDDNPLFNLIDASQTLPPSIWIAKPEGGTSPYAYTAPEDTGDGLSVRALEDESLLAGHLSDMTNAVYGNTYPETHSVLIYQDDALVFEEYFYDYDADRPHQQRSATKTLVAILAGAAYDRGLLKRDDRVLSFFDHYDDLKNVDERKEAITVEDLLTMQSGFACDDRDGDSPGNESTVYQSDDWTRYMLDLPMIHEPGTFGSYCSGNVKITGRIIESVTGKPLKAFADEVLLGPLGITEYDWNTSQDSSNANNYGQIWLRPRDMMKIGVLMHNDGMWQDQQIISQEWIASLTSPISEIGNTPYGYFFWRRYFFPNGKDRVDLPQMTGNGGQKVILFEDQDAIVVMTGGNYNQSSHTRELLAYHILKGFGLDTERTE